MRVLVACEESQMVCKAFRERGHEAYSCDFQYCSGGHPEWHIMHDAVEVAYSGCWDLMIAHPPCKYLAWSGERWMTDNPERLAKRKEAFKFLKTLHDAPIPHICIENSLSYFLERTWKKPKQKVHPFHFGDPFHKTTCFWLNGLKPLWPTSSLTKGEHEVHNMWPSKDRDKMRAKTYPGIARAYGRTMGIVRCFYDWKKITGTIF